MIALLFGALTVLAWKLWQEWRDARAFDRALARIEADAREFAACWRWMEIPGPEEDQ